MEVEVIDGGVEVDAGVESPDENSDEKVSGAETAVAGVRYDRMIEL